MPRCTICIDTDASAAASRSKFHVPLAIIAEDIEGEALATLVVEEPLRQIAYNSGVEGAVVVNNVRAGSGAYGYNAATAVYEDLVKAGVIDPTKVVRVALQNAASVAALMLTTEALVAELPKGDARAADAD